MATEVFTTNFSFEDYQRDLASYQLFKYGLSRSKYFTLSDYHQTENYKIDCELLMGGQTVRYIDVEQSLQFSFCGNKFGYREIFMTVEKYHKYRHLNPLLIRFSLCGTYCVVLPFKLFDYKVVANGYNKKRGEQVPSYTISKFDGYFIRTDELYKFFDCWYETKSVPTQMLRNPNNLEEHLN